MRRVIVESPYAGDVDANVLFARGCVRDCLDRGEAPFASHLLYTQDGVLQDRTPRERALGIAAGLAWGAAADATVVYMDKRITRGMALGIAHARKAGRPVEYRWLKPEHFSASSLTSEERAMIDEALKNVGAFEA